MSAMGVGGVKAAEVRLQGVGRKKAPENIIK